MVNTFIFTPIKNIKDFKNIAKILDNKRLGKQRIEAKEIINILDGKTKKKGFSHHPATLMWKGYIPALKAYYNAMIDEWKLRGYKNTLRKYPLPKNIKIPWFLNNRSILLSYQANLLKKNFDYYHYFFKDVPKKYFYYSYIWISNLPEYKIKQLKNNPNKILDISKYAEKDKNII